MALIRILITQVRVQNRVNTKLHDKSVTSLGHQGGRRVF